MVDYCPVCGQEVGQVRGWDRRELQTTEARAGLANALGVFGVLRKRGAGVTYTRRTPARAKSQEADVVVPLQQSRITGLVMGMGAAGVGLAKGAGLMAAVWGVAGGCVAFGGTWVLLLFSHQRALWVVEEIVGRDLDGDGSKGRPRRADPPVYIHSRQSSVDHENEPEAELEPEPELELGPNEVLARDLGEFLTRGRIFGYGIRDWKGRRMATGTKVSDGLWREWTAILRKGGLMESTNAGTTLKVRLDEALRAISTGGELLE